MPDSQHQHSESISDSFDFLPGMVPTMDDFSSDSNTLARRSGFNQTLLKFFGYQKNGVGTTYRNFAMTRGQDSYWQFDKFLHVKTN